jgi:hypothetical protein
MACPSRFQCAHVCEVLRTVRRRSLVSSLGGSDENDSSPSNGMNVSRRSLQVGACSVPTNDWIMVVGRLGCLRLWFELCPVEVLVVDPVFCVSGHVGGVDEVRGESLVEGDFEDAAASDAFGAVDATEAREGVLRALGGRDAHGIVREELYAVPGSSREGTDLFGAAGAVREDLAGIGVSNAEGWGARDGNSCS